MATIGIINERGEEMERRVISRGAQIDAEQLGGEIEPSLVQNVKFDHKGQMSSITTECGETENRREGDNKVNITVEGIITVDEVDDMRSLRNEEKINFVSDIYSGEVIVKRLSITQSADLLYYKPSGGEQELALNFQLQLKQPE